LTKNELKGLFGLGQHCKLAGEWDKFVIIMLVTQVSTLNKTRGASHCGLAIYIKVAYAERRITETQIFSPCQNIVFKKSSKKSQNPSRYYNSITNLKFQQKPKYHLSKILI
jgi:hypothetical protein